ncbi:hypothetical protein F8154_09325 [Alkaliphilus pronyensis]|uniref:Uncharacterized protein n=1 Tax=Alkaliphilus pronyensis TaxID=1482732 RepID=A0A6I0FA03_9FIRM|nr:hypothetical protein [Alkaliphilus pronyensis]KAB3534128.1 hypothetical protein F8154_09325 [Alkaliphilus pronyensis]
MEKISDFIENIFSVSYTKQTRGKTFFALVLAVIGVFMLPIFFKIEDYNYAKYKEEYSLAEEIVNEYYSQSNTYPIGGPIEWDKEKKLYKFFKEGNLNMNRRLYYINADLVPEIKDFKHKYLVDIDKGTLYTQKSVAYRFRRWHFALLE